jgi:hypothetical protein
MHHKIKERMKRALDECGHENWRKCPFCLRYGDPETMEKMGPYQFCHPNCLYNYQKKYHAGYSKMGWAKKIR